MEKSFISNISKKGNAFLQSNYSFAIFLGSIGLFSIINYFAFAGIGMNEINIDTNWWGSINKNSNNSWIGWFEITIASIGSLLTIWGVILTIRFNKKFIYPLVIGEILVIIDAIILGAVFTAISYSLMILSAIYNFIIWNKSEDELNKSKMNKILWIGVVAFTFFYIAIGFLFIAKTNFYDASFSNFNDIVSSGIVVSCWFIVLRKSKWGFVGFAITDITYMIYFFSSGVWVTGLTYVIYLFIDSISFISWWNTN